MRNLRVSESRSEVHFDYAERDQVQDDVVGLKEKGEIRKEKGEIRKEKGEIRKEK